MQATSNLFLSLLLSAVPTAAVQAQAYLVRDINPGPGGSAPADGGFAVMGDTLFFRANDGSNGAELWKSDGTAAGTVMVADINPGAASSNPTDLFVAGGVLYFRADDGVNGREIWKSDGTAAGTVLVADVNPGPGGSSPASPSSTHFAMAGSTVIFAANDGTNGAELWRTDGTAAGTVMVRDIRPGPASSNPGGLDGGFTVMGGHAYFAANDGVNGRELWKSDGTAAGTAMVADINPGAGGSAPASGGFGVLGNTLFFRGDNGVNGRELWKTDGTAAGTVLVADINAGAADANPANFTAAGSTMFFTADNGVNGRELWKTDGTAAGTAMVQDIRPGAASSTPESLTALGPFLFFTADDGVNGRELWRSLGTASTTAMVRDINPGPSAGLQMGEDRLFLAAGNMRVLMAASEPAGGNELWVSDGTAAGTARVADINAGPGHSNPASFTRVGHLVYFAANDGATGSELWAVPLGAFGGALAEPFGAGCPGTGGLVPSLSGSGLPEPGIGSFAAALQQARASSAALLLLGPRPGSLALGGGCTLLLDPLLLLVLSAPTSGTGQAAFPLPVPNDPALVGGRVYLQALVADPSGSFLGQIAFSNGLRVVVGG